MSELYPRLKSLFLRARRWDVGLNIDAEETERLDISLDLLEALCRDEDLQGWNGIGFVIQAYQKRAEFVVKWVIELARATKRRIMVRLVKGAYWDSEIKRAQVEGLADFPVFTRKIHTDVSYLACAKLLLAAPDAAFPQYATHNAMTLATIHTLAGPNFYAGQYEFQCLHGMGEPLYGQIVGHARDERPCRIYAPVGSHETLLAYLVRRLLENGANSSFVNRIADPNVPVEALIEDPVEVGARDKTVRRRRIRASPCPAICLRPSAPIRRASISPTKARSPISRATSPRRSAAAALPRRTNANRSAIPPTTRDVVGVDRRRERVRCRRGLRARRPPPRRPGRRRAPAERARGPRQRRRPVRARHGQARRPDLSAKPARRSPTRSATCARPSIFCATTARKSRAASPTTRIAPLGVVACISPWNFPIAIFTGQIAAALAAGNAVIAKPAEETPLIAAAAVRLIHEAGVPAEALQLVVGDGEIGAALTVRRACRTASCSPARPKSPNSSRLRSPAASIPRGAPVPLIAETGGQNALIVDSSALAEQVVDGRARFRLRFGGPALLGAAGALPAGRCRRPHARHAEVGDARTEGRAARPTLERRRPRHLERSAREASSATSNRCARAASRVHQTELGADCAARPFPGADRDRDRTRSAISAASSSARSCMCCASGARRCPR